MVTNEPLFNISKPPGQAVQNAAISAETMRSMYAARTFHENNGPVNSVDFNDSGKLMLTSADDDSLVVYDVTTGQVSRNLASKKYGCYCAKFLHSDKHTVYASTKGDDALRLLSLHDNQFIRYFCGHTAKVTDVQVGPMDDMLISASLDKTIRLWDVRDEKCTGYLELPQVGSAAFDPEGLVIGVSSSSEFLKLYDKRSYSNGPFASFTFSHLKDDCWSSICFSEDGKTILVQTTDSYLRLVDAFNGNLIHTLNGHNNSEHLPLKGTFTADSQFIMCGGVDGRILVWSREDGSVVHVFPSDHHEPVRHVHFNRYFHVFASAGKSTKLWILP